MKCTGQIRRVNHPAISRSNFLDFFNDPLRQTSSFEKIAFKLFQKDKVVINSTFEYPERSKNIVRPFRNKHYVSYGQFTKRSIRLYRRPVSNCPLFNVSLFSVQSVLPRKRWTNPCVVTGFLRVEIGDELREDRKHDVDFVNAVLNRLLLRKRQAGRLQRLQSASLQVAMLTPIFRQLLKTVLAAEAQDRVVRVRGWSWRCLRGNNE